MIPHAQKLIDILHYVLDLQKKGIIVRQLPPSSVLVRQNDAEKMPGVAINTPEGAWISVTRQEETSAPHPSSDLLPGMTFYQDPFVPPLWAEPMAEQALGKKAAGEEAAADSEQQSDSETSQKKNDPPVSFFEYLEEWTQWADQEKPKRETNTIYHRLFEVMKDLKLDEGAESKEVVFGLGIVKRFADDKDFLNYPLLIRSCEITFVEQENTIEIRAADASMSIEETPFMDVGLEMDTFKDHLRKIPQENIDLIDPFDPESYHSILETSAGRMAFDGEYIKTLSENAKPKKLTIFNEWCFFLRERPSDRIIKDIHSLEEVLRSGTDIPLALVNLVDKTTIINNRASDVCFRGVTPNKQNLKTGQKQRDLHFPLPYNDEQVSILQKLENNAGVVVQGPPGTGKSHTIANIICHYLAEGKTILVTSTSAGPLGVVREKIPENVRNLTAALLSSDQDSIKELENSLRDIGEKISGFDENTSNRSIKNLHRLIEETHQSIAEKEDTLKSIIEANTQIYTVDGREMSAIELGRIVFEGSLLHNFLDKDVLGATSEEIAPFVERATEIRKRLGEKICQNLPDHIDISDTHEPFYIQPTRPEEILLFPLETMGLESVLAAAHARQSYLAIQEQLDNSLFSLSGEETSETITEGLAQLEEMKEWVDNFEQQNNALQQKYPQWDPDAIKQSLWGVDIQDPQLKRMVGLCKKIIDLYPVGREYDGRITLSQKALNNSFVFEAITRLAHGEKAFSFFEKIKHKDEQELLNTITLDGGTPRDALEWAIVLERGKYLKHLAHCMKLWNEEERLFFVPKLSKVQNEMQAALHLKIFSEGFLGAYRDVFEENPKHRSVMQNLFNQSSPSPKLSRLEELSFGHTVLLKTAEAKIHENNFAEFQEKIKDFLSYHKGEEYHQNFLTAVLTPLPDDYIVQIYEKVKNDIENEKLFQQKKLQEWEEDCQKTQEQFQRELDAWHKDRETKILQLAQDKQWKQELTEAQHSISKAGAKEWSKRMSEDPYEGTEDKVIPSHWKKIWQLQSAHQVYSLLGSHSETKQVMEEIYAERKTLEKAYGSLVEELAWKKISEHSTPQTKSALHKYLNAIKKIGKGTGKRAPRHQKTARDAMHEAYGAIPCWIMPHGRVSESMPAQLGLFDLVIVDEASLADIQILPALLRGKKFLIVGDDKQVSPSGIGKSEEVIQKRAQKFLSHQDFGHVMGPEYSIYDLFSEVFAGNDVMLREHFRSVRPIIEFSNREFYDGKIIPLRMTNNDQNLSPPLVNILVEDGKYNDKTNRAEAEIIAREIQKIVADPAMKNKSIGVVTLISDIKQTNLIRSILDHAIEDQAYLRHDISVGPPTAFQGKERDIIFVSTTWDGQSRSGPQNNSLSSQQFNVAFSRARDRTFLVRSIADGHARPGGLLEKVLRHFHTPILEETSPLDPLVACETPLEKSLAKVLIEKGYRVKAHQGVRGFKIDLTVEGQEGRRLAIACDGDRRDNEDWSEERSRQRVLERAGWTFWRCAAAHFEANRHDVLSDLFTTLNQIGIEPKQSEEEQWVEHRIERAGIIDIAEDNSVSVQHHHLFGPNAIKWPTDRALLMTMCDPKSPPEKALLEEILDLGYRVWPQYEVRGYFVDFLIQGIDGSRMAIEYDGAGKYIQNPDEYKRERERQHYLEVTEGLKFFRISHSEFTSERKKTVKKMQEALEASGIFPIDL